MRVPRVRFTVRRLMVAVVIASVYLTALGQETLPATTSVAFTTPPTLWTSIRAERRESSGDSMSGVEWHPQPYIRRDQLPLPRSRHRV